MEGRLCSTPLQRTKYIVSDLVTSFVAFALFNICRYFITPSHTQIGLEQFIFSPKLILEQVFVPVFMVAIYAISGYYNKPFHKSRLQELLVTLTSTGVNASAIFLFMLTNDLIPRRRVSFQLIFICWGLFFLFTYIFRLIITTQSIRNFKRNQWTYKTLIIGNSRKARFTANSLTESDSKCGYKIVGYVAIPGEEGVMDNSPVFQPEDIHRVVKQLGVDQIIVSPETHNDKLVMQLLDSLFTLNKPVKIVPDIYSYVTSAIKLKDIFGDPLIDLTAPSLSEFDKNIKRLTDIFISSLSLIILSPLMLILAALVKLTSKGDIIYRQERIGWRRRPFTIYKFRTMVADAEKNGPALSSAKDSRITPVGKFMRKYRLDELPQFWNIFKGDMSLVGPRPERLHYIRQLDERVPYYCLIHQVRPGLTSWGMVKYGYASSIEQMIERSKFDLLYISNMSLSVDMKILIYTVRTVISGLGK